MIARLRRRHRRAFVALAPALLALFALALAARPRELVGDVPRVPQGTATIVHDHEPVPVAVTVEDGTVRLVALRTPTAPDVLVYGCRADAPRGTLAAEARYLGTLEERRAPVALPADAGRLVLYSLLHAAVVAEIPLPER